MIITSLKILNENHLELEREAIFFIDDAIFNMNSCIIPFSDLFQKKERLDEYKGQENIPFADRDPEYKDILLSEFL